eukprot:GGOE01020207.1.p1 GENE.GGOE01020207.1~~GGOE01020207.1.p1  ORF type:complete len:352 (+),score=5.69 GGOE01020207.1:37-1092(+)
MMAYATFSRRSSASSIGPDVDSHRGSPPEPSALDDFAYRLDRLSAPFSRGPLQDHTLHSSDAFMKGAKSGLLSESPSPIGSRSISPLDSPVVDIVWETAPEPMQRASPSKDFPSPSWSKTNTPTHIPNKSPAPLEGHAGSAGAEVASSASQRRALPSALRKSNARSRSLTVRFADEPSSTPARRMSHGALHSEGGRLTDWSVFLASEAHLPTFQPKSAETKVISYTPSYSKPYVVTAGPQEWTLHKATFANLAATRPAWTTTSFPSVPNMMVAEKARSPSIPFQPVQWHSGVNGDLASFRKVDAAPSPRAGAIPPRGSNQLPTSSQWQRGDATSRMQSWSFPSGWSSNLHP